MQVAFLHPNWPLLRKQWLSSVTTCVNPKDFARALIVLQVCLKPVVFASVWHESLGKILIVNLSAQNSIAYS
jgi:nucleosome-remodeling factor subunit BPTF